MKPHILRGIQLLVCLTLCGCTKTSDKQAREFFEAIRSGDTAAVQKALRSVNREKLLHKVAYTESHISFSPLACAQGSLNMKQASERLSDSEIDSIADETLRTTLKGLKKSKGKLSDYEKNVNLIEAAMKEETH